MKKFHDLAYGFVQGRKFCGCFCGLRLFTDDQDGLLTMIGIGYPIDGASMAEIDAWEIERSIGLAAKRQHKAETI